MRVDLKNLIPGLCGLVFGGWLVYETFLLDVDLAYSVGGGMSAAGYPRLLGLGILGLSALIICKSILKRFLERAVANGQEESSVDRSGLKKVGVAVLGLVIYTLLLNTVGYLIITPFVLALVMILVGARNWLYILATSILLTISLHLVSLYVFHIMLPEGLLE